MEFQAYRYAADGHAGGEGDGEVIATGTLEECRAAIAERINGDLADMRWHGSDGDVDAYHESDEEGCGGYAIRLVGVTRYALVSSEAVDTYVHTHGDLADALSRHETLEQARQAASEVAGEYHYGVEIVDEAEWAVVE